MVSKHIIVLEIVSKQILKKIIVSELVSKNIKVSEIVSKRYHSLRNSFRTIKNSFWVYIGVAFLLEATGVVCVR